MKFFYVRVSSKEQNEGRQLEIAKGMGIDGKCIYIDKESGKNLERPQWKKLMDVLRIGDILVVQDLSRLSRSRKDIKDVWKELTGRGINIEIVNMPILNTDKYSEMGELGEVITNMVFELLSWMVEDERKRIKNNQKQGIALAKKEGKYKGRPIKYHKDAVGADKLVYNAIINELEKGVSVKELAINLNISRNTIYKIKKQKLF